MDNQKALTIAIKIIKQFEGCNLRAYPDPASDLYKELSKHNILKDYMSGKLKELPPYLDELDGSPFTIGYGQTKGVKKGDIWSQEHAENDLFATVGEVAAYVLKTSPNLAKHSSEKVAAVTSLCYNIGRGNYSPSTVARKIAADDMQGAANGFLLWNKAHGVVLDGLVKRRNLERNLFLSVTN